MSDTPLEDVGHFIKRYVVMSDEQLLVVSLWVLHAYVFDAFPQTPYLAVNSPEKQCGKTRLLEVLHQVCPRSWSAINPSEAVVFRMIEAKRPTLLLDEVDGIFSARSGDKYEHLRTLLNAGTRAGMKVPRVLDPKSDKLKEYSVFCPKVLAGIGTLPETIVDRSIPIRLERRTRDQPIERFRLRDVEPAAVALRDQIIAWGSDLGPVNDEPEMPDELSDRQQEACEPLVALADELGYGEKARAALVSILTAERADSVDSARLTLLRDMHTWFSARPDREAAYTSWLVDELKKMEERPWKTWNHGRGLDDRALAALLKPYGVHSEPVRADGEHQLRGYRRDKLQVVWDRYLPVTDCYAHPAPSADLVTDASLTVTDAVTVDSGSR